jgi:hypothetical protein
MPKNDDGKASVAVQIIAADPDPDNQFFPPNVPQPTPLIRGVAM